jgi:predicted Rossmann fold nucleotide-binding protein DprA/Smf involved in DNA uptake
MLNWKMKDELTTNVQSEQVAPPDAKHLLSDVQRLIQLHGDITSLTLMRALKIPYATALDAIIQFEMDGAIQRKGNGRYRLNFR